MNAPLCQGVIEHRNMDRSTHKEIWVQGPDSQAMCALTNGELGWLMYIRHSEDAGFSSRNPHYDGPAEAEIEYVLSNGQVDRYPASWALPIREVEAALAYFKEHHKSSPSVHWHNDSDDENVIGNDA